MKFIKRPLMKMISLTASSFAVLIVSGFLSLQPIDVSPTFAQAPGPVCDDISLTPRPADRSTTDSVNSAATPGRVARVSDSGMLDFNLPADPAYQACVSTSKQTWKPAGQPAAITGYFMNGWTWNTNMGNISMYCKDGTNGPGAGCGAVDYGVVATPRDGRIRGFAWGDNIGWISMGCDVSGGAGTNLGVPCGEVPYGVQIARQADEGKDIAGCKALQIGDLYGYAWANTVGWVNFCGARVSLTPQHRAMVNVEVTREAPAAGGAGAEVDVDPNVAYANGSDAYNIIIKILDGGVPMDSVAGLDVSIDDIEWEKSDLCADQITNRGVGVACDPDGAIIPKRSNDFTWNQDKKGFVGTVKAISPTTTGPDVRLGTSNSIVLKELTVFVDGVGQILMPKNPDGTSLSFEFKPAIEVKRIVSGVPLDSGNLTGGDQISVVKNSSEPVYISIVKHPGAALPGNEEINVYTQAHSCDRAFDFIFDEGQIGTSTDEEALTNLINGAEANFPHGSNREDIEIHGNPLPCEAPLQPETLSDINKTLLNGILNGGNLQGVLTKLIYSFVRPGAEDFAPNSTNVNNVMGMRVRVEYRSEVTVNGSNPHVKYFAKTVSDGSLLNQAANVKGNVRIDVQKFLKPDVVTKSIGEAAQSKRVPFVKVINNLTRSMAPGSASTPGAYLDSGGSYELSSIRVSDYSARAGSSTLFYAKQRTSGATKPCKIIFPTEGEAHQAFSENFTLLTIGCDIYINKGIYATADDVRLGGLLGRLGIIAFEDLSMADDRKGGNIYICNAVTDVEANIVADGSIFSYGKDANDCGNLATDGLIDLATGVPIFKLPSRVAARNQLTIKGSLISNNTYGGAFSTPPLLGDGTQIINLADVYKARLYDLNFLRYANTRDPTPEEAALGVSSCWTDDVRKSKTITPPGTTAQMCNSNNPDNRGIVNIIYQPPIKGMPIFDAVK